MKMIPLGRTDIQVSDWCLGTMTFGNQTPQDDAHRQIDMALDAGLNFLDTAEMYPVNPIRKETVGLSEQVIGNWIAKTGRRDDIVVATKVSGNNPGWVRDGRGYDGAVITEAIETSLKRLQTDVIDLYQMHWPVRGSYMFRQNWTYDPSGQNRQQTLDHMVDVLEALGTAVKAGKIRAIGMSNESAWGMTRWIDQAEAAGLPRMASVQNEYSLLCRLYDTDMAEMAVNEDVTLLSFSPLACGLLTGKYQGGVVPDGSRMSIGPELGGRMTDRTLPVTQAYLDLAADHGLDPVHMAMAWQATRPFPVSAIFGATTSDQLEHILAGKDVTLDEAVINEIDQTHRANPMPY
ncbi:aldo/keto reductase [Yoonia sediminilitoris]|uniref:Aryl-alcohol dehydrogenase-like predicted oxidoreductase n=1 Tax=Yoonia sediminilitoris TaxID=1286148 RepID=A0A2T6KB87_9RHOB|nr:aldo/keto reductase [Yoonia sediminilitoris]PUB12081.1 aryl-alcohol dehydrogenase-like predicted oxidoreductase [Yoonia sediminilitoris]RCW92908.1 aryl-alcohol dehydrogenase-like predicted oxidoreductase [Yoonia sediminilitoris]